MGLKLGLYRPESDEHSRGLEKVHGHNYPSMFGPVVAYVLAMLVQAVFSMGPKCYRDVSGLGINIDLQVTRPSPSKNILALRIRVSPIEREQKLLRNVSNKMSI